MITAEMQDTANDRAVKKKTSIIFRIAVAISPIRGGITGKRIDCFERRQAGDHGDQKEGGVGLCSLYIDVLAARIETATRNNKKNSGLYKGVDSRTEGQNRNRHPMKRRRGTSLISLSTLLHAVLPLVLISTADQVRWLIPVARRKRSGDIRSLPELGVAQAAGLAQPEDEKNDKDQADEAKDDALRAN
jgi:hypothetical protein